MGLPMPPITEPTERDREHGAALILALVFVTVAALVGVSLANLSGTNLLNTSALQAQRNVEYASDAATDAAVQAIRYHGSCESYPPSGTVSIDGYHVFVSCSGSTMTGATIDGTKLTPPSGQYFIPEDVGLQVYDQYISGGGFTTVTEYNASDGSLTVATGSSQTDSSAFLGSPFERVTLLSACASTGAISSCTPSHAVVSAALTYYDSDGSGNPSTGYNVVVNRWDVNPANA